LNKFYKLNNTGCRYTRYVMLDNSLSNSVAGPAVLSVGYCGGYMLLIRA